ncbi:MAG: hypothetical protein JNG84_04055, partial [Archangium sp.]|nr:hypothetical protein [Archangium sp.]
MLAKVVGPKGWGEVGRAALSHDGMGGGVMEAHGGYLCLYEDVDVAWLQALAAGALRDDGQDIDDVGLQLTVLGGPRIIRFAWDGPFTYGRRGAVWYRTHHTFAKRLSAHLGGVV